MLQVFISGPTANIPALWGKNFLGGKNISRHIKYQTVKSWFRKRKKSRGNKRVRVGVSEGGH